MNRNISTLFSTRIIRLFCYGFLSVILALYLEQVGLIERQIGLLFTLTLVGDAGISLLLTTSADRFGRKRTLIVRALSSSSPETSSSFWLPPSSVLSVRAVTRSGRFYPSNRPP